MDDIGFHFSVAFLLSILLIVYLRLTPWSHLLEIRPTVLSGAFGNMLDRFVLNYVIDWIDVRWNFFGWYAFQISLLRMLP